jgi:hypothetical protein
MPDYQYYNPRSDTANTSTLAIISLIAGILGLFMLPLIGAIAAIITGHMANREIKESQGQLTGEGLATAGLILVYVELVLAILALCAVGIFFLIFPICFGTSVFWENLNLPLTILFII